jgi:hypothetical protein
LLEPKKLSKDEKMALIKRLDKSKKPFARDLTKRYWAQPEYLTDKQVALCRRLIKEEGL